MKIFKKITTEYIVIDENNHEIPVLVEGPGDESVIWEKEVVIELEENAEGSFEKWSRQDQYVDGTWARTYTETKYFKIKKDD